MCASVRPFFVKMTILRLRLGPFFSRRSGFYESPFSPPPSHFLPPSLCIVSPANEEKEGEEEGSGDAWLREGKGSEKDFTKDDGFPSLHEQISR